MRSVCHRTVPRRPPRFPAATLAAVLVVGTAPAGVAAADTARSDLRPEQWVLDAVDAPDAWETTRGAGIVVAVLGAGVDDTHPDLAGDVVDGLDLVEEGDPAASERDTMLAGIVAASGHGVEHTGGVLGVAPDAAVLPVRVTTGDEQPAEPAVLAEGIREAVTARAQVLVLPAGPEVRAEPDPAERRAVNYARERGVVVVSPAVAGGDEPGYPAGYDGVVVVGAVTAENALTDDSGRYPGVALTAPGNDVITTAPDGEYARADGPEAAAAVVSGVAALVRSAHPQLRPEQVEEALLAGAAPNAGVRDEGENGDGGGDGHGAGTLDAAATLAAAGALAEDVPPFDETLAAEAGADDGPPWLVAVLGGVVVVLAAALTWIVVRTRRAG